MFACRFRKHQKKREIFRLKELKTALAPFLETFPLKNKTLNFFWWLRRILEALFKKNKVQIVPSSKFSFRALYLNK